MATLGELRTASGDADSTGAASAGGALSTGGATLVAAISGAMSGYGWGSDSVSGRVPAAGGVPPLTGTAASVPAHADASTSPASAVSTVAATGSQTGHSRTVGAISRPHSGQIQWNMPLIYTQNRQLPFSHTPYCHECRNLRGVRIPTQGMFEAPPLVRRCIQRRPAKNNTTRAIPKAEA